MAQAYISVKTIFGAALEASRRPGNSFSVIPYSTLNEHFGVLAGAALPAGKQPETKFLAIGRGGHQNVAGGKGESLTDTKQHRINNARLFDHLPFVLRPVNNDLSAAERAKYRMRKLVTVSGAQYFAYYLKVITSSAATPKIEKVTINAGIPAREDYVPTAAQLTPQAVSMSNGVINQATGEHLAVTTPFNVELSDTDITEILNAVNIMYSDPRFAVISEIAIVSGIDDTTTSTDGGVSASYTEAKAAQIFNFIGTNISLMQQSSGVRMEFRIGTTLPYLT